jgi:hypothetical protein
LRLKKIIGVSGSCNREIGLDIYIIAYPFTSQLIPLSNTNGQEVKVEEDHRRLGVLQPLGSIRPHESYFAFHHKQRKRDDTETPLQRLEVEVKVKENHRRLGVLPPLGLITQTDKGRC